MTPETVVVWFGLWMPLKDLNFFKLQAKALVKAFISHVRIDWFSQHILSFCFCFFHICCRDGSLISYSVMVKLLIYQHVAFVRTDKWSLHYQKRTKQKTWLVMVLRYECRNGWCAVFTTAYSSCECVVFIFPRVHFTHFWLFFYVIVVLLCLSQRSHQTRLQTPMFPQSLESVAPQRQMQENVRINVVLMLMRSLHSICPK